MIKIIGNRSTGKTSRLLLLAKEINGIIVCKNVDKMRDRSYKYGLTGIDFISYQTYIEQLKNGQNDSRPIYIDDLSDFLRVYDKNISGYSEIV